MTARLKNRIAKLEQEVDYSEGMLLEINSVPKEHQDFLRKTARRYAQKGIGDANDSGSNTDLVKEVAEEIFAEENARRFLDDK